MTFEALDQMQSPGLRKPCRVSCWQLGTSLAAAWQQRLRLLCLCLGWSQTGNRRLTPTVWYGCPESSPGLSKPALSALDQVVLTFSFPVHPPYPCRGRQWNSAPSQRVPCHHEWLQLRGNGSWRHPVTGCSYHLHHYAWWARCFAHLHLRGSLLNHINGDWPAPVA